MYTTLKLTFETKIATLTLNRAAQRNAISQVMIEEFLQALREAEESSAQVLIVCGEGKAFCAGMDMEDLQRLAKETEAVNHRHSQRIATMFRALYEFPKTTIASVHGIAVAGGAALATLCDFTVACTTARFGYTEVRIGFVPAIVSSFLIRQVGEKRARELLLTGRIVGAAEAYRMGLVNEVVEAAELTARVHRLADQLLENSPASLRATKALLRNYGFEELNRHIENGMEANASMRTSADFKEGVASFLEKRKPRWSE
jgi:methylglutaconyl-CoA hydratase